MQCSREQAAATGWKDKIYICGGVTDGGVLTNRVECFDSQNERWILLPDVPTWCCGHTLVSYRNKLILMGGHDGRQECDTVWELDPQQSNAGWKQLPSMKYRSYFFAGIVLEKDVYAIGGIHTKNQPLSRVEIFDGERWREGPSLPNSWINIVAVIIPQHFADHLCHNRA